MNKMRKEDYFRVLRDLAENVGDNMSVEFCDKELAKIESRKGVKTKAQKANEELVEVVYDALERVDRAVTVTELQKADEEVGVFSNQKVSALLKMLKDDGRVVKTMKGKTAYFSIAKEEEEVEE